MIQEYEKWVIEFFGMKGLDDFDITPCPFGCPPEDSVTCFWKAGLEVRRCKCGMVWNGFQPTEKCLQEFYEKSRAMEMWAEHKATPEQLQKQEEKFGEAIHQIKKREFGSVLDVGAGNGVFLRMCLDRLPNVALFGTEVSPVARAASANQGIILNNQSLDALIEEGMRVDIVTLWGVLEHLKDPLETLKKIRKLSKHVLVCVPNVESTVVRLLGKKAFTFCPQHLWYFDTWTLDRLLRRAGFSPYAAWDIEPETEPIRKHLALFDDPYRKDIPEWAWADQPDDILGYKIVRLAE